MAPVLMQINKAIFFFFLLGCALFSAEGRVQAFFPEDQIAERLIEAIHAEETSLKVAIYAITHKGIADALARAKMRGVAVEVILDPFSVKNRASIAKLLEGRVPLFVWDQGEQMKKEGRHKGLMHDKFCVFGGDKVWTGSFNFTYAAASRHRENALLIEDRKIAQEYLAQFSKMQLSESRPYQEYLAQHPKKKGTKRQAGVK